MDGSEIEQFEAHHGIGSKAVLALRLILATGGARADICRMGWQNIKDGSRIEYRRSKTGQDFSANLEYLPAITLGRKRDRAV